ncbi:DUF2235 domain-containing protein [Thalassorhabdomicrobium marinisediminis]|uniref:T6SS Phospholipase effector Tle1-like catalytic domain-containing protein n=1 Tax=Thalassorhabdomicrobium marinisediminis TaxID=2170577 RepID=A0A2T7FXE3_9RHOB|nr:DUF2235 domain-containing protein [Thalassorhabdomicrobium marinisediminis]PVA06824.1 hypothetical protein DC363_06595 [Thalassorhabdomicrobium marinisediminis]
MSLRSWLSRLFGRPPYGTHDRGRRRGPAMHVVVLDGTMSSLEPGYETNAGLLYKLLREAGHSANLTLYYEPGIQWAEWRTTLDVLQGRGITKQIQRAYGVLASRYRPGDSIVLAGYSRGAYAVRSLAGVIDLVGLLRPEHATERMVKQAFRHYRLGGRGPAAEAFRGYCHDEVRIEAVAAWDTVKALGLRWPILWRWSDEEYEFHNHALGASIRNGFHALALDETREAYAPVLWSSPPGWSGHVEQVWFPGNHADVGGQIDGLEAVRPLSNLSLVWMLGRLESCGVPLPEDWRRRFPTDPEAPSVGPWRKWSKLFLGRKRRAVGLNDTERLHPSVADRGLNVPPLALEEPSAPTG